MTGFYDSVCMTLPPPPGIDPGTRVREKLREAIRDGIGGSSGLDDALDELDNSAGNIQWSNAEAKEFVANLSGWWVGHKKLLHNRTPMLFGSPADNTKRTIRKAVRALSSVISQIHRDSDNGANINSLSDFLADLAAHSIPVKVLEAATLNIAVGDREHVTRKVAAALLDKDHDVVVDGLMAARILARFSEEGETRSDFLPVATMLVQGVQWRHRPALPDRLRVVAGLVRHHTHLFPTEVLCCLLNGLEEIAVETSRSVRGNDEDSVISTRAAAASLAFALFEHYRASALEEPKVIRRWRELCGNPDEFSEVRNSWG